MGADVNAQGGDYGNALYVASERGHEAIPKPPIEKGADINAQGGDNGNALLAASKRGHEAIAYGKSLPPALVFKAYAIVCPMPMSCWSIEYVK